MALADRATARLGRSLVDGFAADRVVRALARIRRERTIGQDSADALKRAAALVSRVSQGDRALAGQEPGRYTLGSGSHVDRGVLLVLDAQGRRDIGRLQRNLKALLRGHIPNDQDLVEIEDFFADLGKTVLRQTQTIERPRRLP